MPTEVTVRVAAEMDDERLDELTSRLARELRELDVVSVRALRVGPAPEGTRAAEAVELGALVVALVTSPALVTAVVDTARAWVSSSPARSVRLELAGDTIELTKASEDEQRRLVEAWIERHAGR